MRCPICGESHGADECPLTGVVVIKGSAAFRGAVIAMVCVLVVTVIVLTAAVFAGCG
ncbi:MAG: hypothetical protein V1748_00265 [Actinomycetota bacterium]